MKRFFSCLYKFLAVIGVGVFLLPIAKVAVVEFGYPFEFLSRVAFVLACVAAGYIFAALVATVFRYKRADDFSTDKRLAASISIFSSVVAVITAFLLVPTFRKMFYVMYEHRTNLNIHYDDKSLLPYFAAFLTAGFIIFGILVWFVPSHKLINEYSLIWYVALALLEYLFCLDNDLMMFVICVFLVTSAIILNQGCISRTVYDSVADITVKQRGYNMALALTFTTLVIPIFFVSACIVAGVVVLIRIPIFLFAQSVTQNEETDPFLNDYYESGGSTADAFGESVFGGMDNMAGYFVGFLVICLILFTMLGLKNRISFSEVSQKIVDFFKNIAESIKELLEPIMEFFGGDGLRRISAEITENTYYRDEEIKLQKAVINPYDNSGVERMSYKEFYRNLTKFPDLRSQLAYSYTVLRALYKNKIDGKVSDTPRQTNQKLNKYGVSFDINYVTQKYEKLFYADFDLDEREAEKTLYEMCSDIRNKLPK